jgi:polysaccharide biosynthesis/export protein
MKGRALSDGPRLRGAGYALVALAATLVLALAAGSGTPAQAGQVPATGSGAAQPAAAAKAGPAEYVIGAGDTLSIVVAQNPDLSAESVPVRPDGRISTPLANDVVAVGKTPTGLAREI